MTKPWELSVNKDYKQTRRKRLKEGLPAHKPSARAADPRPRQQSPPGPAHALHLNPRSPLPVLLWGQRGFPEWRRCPHPTRKLRNPGGEGGQRACSPFPSQAHNPMRPPPPGPSSPPPPGLPPAFPPSSSQASSDQPPGRHGHLPLRAFGLWRLLAPDTLPKPCGWHTSDTL